jgi:hypothetical protein
MARWIILAIVGSIVCTIGDHLHATHGVLWYPHVFAWDQAWWVPLLFACASVAAVLGATPFRRLLSRGREDAAPTAREIAGDGIAFFTAYAFTSFMPADLPNVTLGLLFAWWLARVVRGRPAWQIAFSIAMAAAGTLFEAGWSALGFFYYRHPDFIGVGRWLPGIYLHAALLAAPLERTLRGAEGSHG